MPKLFNIPDTEVQKTVSNFGYSAKKPDALGGSKYTLARLSFDVSGTITPFQADLEKAVETCVGALAKGVTKNNTLLSVETFASSLSEVHGFLPFKDLYDAATGALIDPDTYKFITGGGTALNDGALSGVEALGAYAEQLDAFDYLVNGVLIQVTDGAENSSRVARNASKVKAALDKVRASEKLESLKTILVFIGDPDAQADYINNKTYRQLTEEYKDAAGFDQLEFLTDLTEEGLAQLGGFISRSVSSSSQHLGTGGPSKNLPLTF